MHLLASHDFEHSSFQNPTRTTRIWNHISAETETIQLISFMSAFNDSCPTAFHQFSHSWREMLDDIGTSINGGFP